MYAYRDNAHTNMVKAAYGSDENGPQACAPICGGSVKARSLSFLRLIFCACAACRGWVDREGNTHQSSIACVRACSSVPAGLERAPQFCGLLLF